MFGLIMRNFGVLRLSRNAYYTFTLKTSSIALVHPPYFWDKSLTAKYASSKGGTSITSQIFVDSALQPRDQSYPNSVKSVRGGGVENLAKDIINLRCTEQVADLLESTLSVQHLDEKNIGNLFSALHKAVRGEKSDTKKRELMNSVGMQKVMKSVKHYCRWLSPPELINIIKLFSFLNLSGTHPTLQTILRILSKQVNSLTLTDIIYTSFLLDKLNPSPIVTALQMALPVVFESQLSLKLDRTSPQELSDALFYAVKNSLSDTTVQKIIDDLMPLMNNLSPKQCMSVIWSLADSKRRLRQEVVITTALKTLANSYDQFSINEINTTMTKISKKYSKTYNYFYNEDFVGKFCQYMSEKRQDVDDESAVYSLRYIEHFRHVDIAYLDRASEIILSNPSILLNSDYVFSIVMRALSSANYKPETWDRLEPILLNHPYLTKTKDLEIGAIPLALDFLTLDSFPSSFISKLFSPISFPLLDQYVKFHSPYIPLLILKCIKLCYPEYDGPFPPASMVANWKNMVLKIPKTYPLKSAIQAGIGGANYVLTGLFHEGFHIDHAVAYRKGGYPVSLEVTEPVLLEELQLPSESNIVMIKALMAESYATNTNRLRGIYAFELKLIEKLGYSVVTLDAARWKELQDAEKVPFLMHRIREKMDLSGPTDY